MSFTSSILELNDHLPKFFQSNDPEILIDHLGTILSVTQIVDGLKEPSLNEELPLLVKNTHNQIMRESHPYYSQNYCRTNKSFEKLCDDNKYVTLQQWCFPSLSPKQIKELLPNIRFSQVVELSLVYSPIPESIKYWDRITLFYYACERNYPNPEMFIKNNKGNIIFQTYRLDWIAYKFNRLDLLENLFENEVMANVWKFKHGKKELDEPDVKQHIEVFLESFIPYIMGTIMSYEEIIDLIIDTSDELYDIVIKGLEPEVWGRVNSGDVSSIPINHICVLYMVCKLGLDKVTAMLRTHGHTDNITTDYSTYKFDNVNTSYYPILHKHWLRDNPEWISVEFDNNTRFVYDITSGNLIDYINHVGLADKSKLDYRTIFGYAGINQFGGITFNKVIADIAYSKKNALRSLGNESYSVIYDTLIE